MPELKRYRVTRVVSEEVRAVSEIEAITKTELPVALDGLGPCLDRLVVERLRPGVDRPSGV